MQTFHSRIIVRFKMIIFRFFDYIVRTLIHMYNMQNVYYSFHALFLQPILEQCTYILWRCMPVCKALSEKRTIVGTPVSTYCRSRVIEYSRIAMEIHIFQVYSKISSFSLFVLFQFALSRCQHWFKKRTLETYTSLEVYYSIVILVESKYISTFAR